MKFIVVLCALLPLLAAQGVTQCRTDSDCGSGECCTRSIFGSHHADKRKRFVLEDILGHHHHYGHCKALATEGQSCVPDTFAWGGSMAHHLGCPCVQGLECHGEREHHQDGSHSYTNPKCMPAGAYTGPTREPVTPASTAAPDTNQPPVEEVPGK